MKRKFTLNLMCLRIGIQADQYRAIELAHRFGFESVEAQVGQLADMDQGELEALLESMKEKDLVWGCGILPVGFKQDRSRLEDDLKALPRLAAGLQRAGVTRLNTWITPSHNELTYNRNFQQHVRRLRDIATILKDYGLRLGFEYFGSTTALLQRKYPFIQSLAETRELCEAIGTGNVGYHLDSFHWWQAEESDAEIEALDQRDITFVDLCDAPLGIDFHQQTITRRELPLATDAIDIKAFLNALVKIGYDGPLRAEPFNQTVNDMDDESACRVTIKSLKKAMALID